MESSNISIDCGPNYLHYAQAMTRYLKSRRLWRIVTEEITAPVRKEGETKEKYYEWQEDWDDENVDISTCIYNTSITRIN